MDQEELATSCSCISVNVSDAVVCSQRIHLYSLEFKITVYNVHVFHYIDYGGPSSKYVKMVLNTKNSQC